MPLLVESSWTVHDVCMHKLEKLAYVKALPRHKQETQDNPSGNVEHNTFPARVEFF